MSFCHLILTRFNVQYEPNDVIGIQPEWLEERLRLFEQYCIPSVQHQTCPYFIWVLLCDIRTPETYRKRIEHYQVQSPQIQIYWCSYQSDGYHSTYREIAKKHMRKGDLLITSRLDNDDTLAPDYIARVQEIAENGIEGIVSFPIGKQVFTRDNKSYKIRYLQNHSTSRIERTGFNTIMAYDHTQVDAHSVYTVETAEPMWEEIVHGSNMLNDYVPKYRYYPTNISDVCDLLWRWIRFQTHRVHTKLQKYL